LFPELSFAPTMMRSGSVSASTLPYYGYERTVKAQTILPSAKDLT
jgi:hypothetical protein